MKVDYTPGEFVVVYSLFCGSCNEQFDGLHVGVIGVRVPDEEVVAAFGPTPHYYVRELTCPGCKDADLYDGGAIYSHRELIPASDDVMEVAE